MLSGLKDFVLRGNLIELAVAFIMGAAFSEYDPHGVSVGAWITAVISFLLLSAVVYFLIVVPYTRAKERWFARPRPGTPEDVRLLQQIRDLLAAERQP